MATNWGKVVAANMARYQGKTSSAEIARKACLCQATVTKLASGGRELVALATLERVAIALGCDTVDLLAKSED